MTSSEEVGVDTIHVRLLDEPIPVWRPVKAKALGNGRLSIGCNILKERMTEVVCRNGREGSIALRQRDHCVPLPHYVRLTMDYMHGRK